MRLPRWVPWIAEVMAGSPAITGVETFEQAGITEKPVGHVITLRTGAKVAIQWVRTSADGGDDHSQPEKVVTGEVMAPVTLPELPTSGRTRLTLIEEHLAALIANGGSDEVRTVERTSTRPGVRTKCGINIRMHSGAVINAMFLHTAPAGASVTSGGAYQQREEV